MSNTFIRKIFDKKKILNDKKILKLIKRSKKRLKAVFNLQKKVNFPTSKAGKI